MCADREAEILTDKESESERKSFSLALVFAIVSIGAAANAAAPSMLHQFRVQQNYWLTNPDLGVSKIVFICIMIGIWRVASSLHGPARPWHVFPLLPAAIGTLGVSGNSAWAGLALSAIAFLAVFSQPSGTRCGLWIILLGALHSPGTSLLGQMAGGNLLAIDQFVTVSILSLFETITPIQGNVIQTTGGEAILLVWECGVLKNIALVLLLWLTMLQLLIGPEYRAPLADAVLLVGVCVAINTVRLSLMAITPDWFDLFHDGAGATTLRLLLLSTPVALAWWTANHARA